MPAETAVERMLADRNRHDPSCPMWFDVSNEAPPCDCSLPDDIRAIEADLRGTGLDVERLARAIGVTNRNGWANGVSPLTYTAWSRAIAAEYEKLEQRTTPEPQE